MRRHQNAQDAFDDAACAYLGINRSDGRALDVVERHGRVSAGQLAAETGLSTGAITTLVDRLERAGYVRRVRDEADRRRVLVELTGEARRRTREIWGPIAEQSAGLFAETSDAELMFLRDFLHNARGLLAEHLERVNGLQARSARRRR